MFITADCVLFLIKLRWPKNKSLYEVQQTSQIIIRYKWSPHTRAVICIPEFGKFWNPES